MDKIKEKLTPPTISTSKGRKNKPRPANLDLSNSISPVGTPFSTSTTPNHNDMDMGSIAIKCISHGLPPLSAKMKTTFLISKSIEAQQRQLIASRNSASEEKDTGKDQEMKNIDDDEEDGEEKEDNEDNKENKKAEGDTIALQSATGLSATMQHLTIPSAKSKLKRKNIPSPLNLNLNADFRSQSKPRINSAPLYASTHLQQSGFFTPSTSRRSQFRVTKPQHLVQSRTSFTSQPPRIVRPSMTPITGNPYQQPQYLSHTRPFTGMPQTALPRNAIASIPHRTSMLTQQQLARYQAHLSYQQAQWEKFKEYKESSKRNSVVADVFREGTRFAPLNAQPLSAQRQFFDREEVKPLPPQNSHQQQHSLEKQEIKVPSEIPEGDEDEDEDVENNAIEPDAKVGLPSLLVKNSHVKTEIRLGNDLFKFDFERRGEGQGDKERFLNHCATVWDEFKKLG